ncbi:PA0061/PA0062 family lipoprotein [Stutzerimonas chloritidismutans]|uniref:PA0061/PA0062 family lipoprotein n=1 Tax=Stutzerimonas chloritidismutans TaxID=203192 RepID=UPI003F18C1B2
MRILLVALALTSLSGCALWMPKHDPSQAWVELAPNGETELKAVAVDQKPLDDHRYFQVTPGSHQLGMRYRFEVAPADVGRDSDALERDCRLTLDYDRFNAGMRYRLVAGGYGFRPWARLYDQHDQLLAKATERGCGGVATR